ncbi:hypothetical protein KUCAC02_023590 [Chaenocephalus aceratus]|nr:hypothetical protein KUCAC02_023590 [Chaenocephalus aceratus]
MERRVVFCLLCNTPQLSIRTHLHRVCMKEHTPEQRAMEEVRARTSQKHFNRVGRVWKFSELETFCKDAASCVALCQRLESRGLLVADSPPTYQHIEPSKRSHDVDILAAAADDMDFFKSRLVVGHSLPKVAVTSLRSYCVAIMLLQHRIATNAVVEFEVQQWLDRKPVSGGATILLAGPVAAGQRFTLSPREEGLLDCYFCHIRPVLHERTGPRQGPVLYWQMREPAVQPLLGPAAAEKKASGSVAEADSPSASTSTGQPPGASLSDPLMGQTPSGASRLTSGSVRNWKAFCDTFPVSLHAAPPTKFQCVRARFPCHMPYYKKWREAQLRQRADYILCHAVGRQGNRPTEAAVQRVLGKERWTTNRPCVEDLLKAWVPPQQVAGDYQHLLPCLLQQSWKGLSLKDFGQAKGKGVVATMPFSKGEVVCDYHGELISNSVGNQREQSGYLFFFGKRFCIDATTFPCGCHPEQDTFGRMLNHSRHNPNVRAKKVKVTFPDGPRDALVFLARRNIRVGEELMWDYNIKRQSFGGEGKDLAWLDE